MKLRALAKPWVDPKVGGSVLELMEPVALLPVMVPSQFDVYVALRSVGPVPPIPVRINVKEKWFPVT
jgi:hypothetical protein